MNVLICHQPEAFGRELSVSFRENNVHTSVVEHGKDCQLKIFKEEPTILVIDIATKLHSAIEVIKYVRVNNLPTLIYLCFPDQRTAEALKMTPEVLLKMGIQGSVFVNEGAPKVVETILGQDAVREAFGDYESLSEVHADGNDMRLINALELLVGTKALMDYYRYEGENRYVRVYSRGEVISKSLNQTLYFRVKDRLLYIKFMNSVLQKTFVNRDAQTTLKFTAMKSVADEYVSECFVKGINTKLVEEGKRVCEAMFTFVETDRGLRDLMRFTAKEAPAQYSRLFLVSFFSTIISKGLGWSTKRTAELVALAGLVHDIGLSKEELEMTESQLMNMPPKLRETYKKHPALAANLLNQVDKIPQPVVQIVFQHQELINGEGYPNGLSSVSIYPLAKIVSLAIGFVNHMVEKDLSPMQTLGEFVRDGKNLERYDSEMIRALIKSFVKEKV